MVSVVEKRHEMRGADARYLRLLGKQAGPDQGGLRLEPHMLRVPFKSPPASTVRVKLTGRRCSVMPLDVPPIPRGGAYSSIVAAGLIAGPSMPIIGIGLVARLVPAGDTLANGGVVNLLYSPADAGMPFARAAALLWFDLLLCPLCVRILPIRSCTSADLSIF